MEEGSLDDYDVSEESPGPADTWITNEAVAQVDQERIIKAYLVKDTSYRTFVDDLSGLGYSLICVQSTRSHLVHLFRRDLFLPC